jgi:hypothetical protein
MGNNGDVADIHENRRVRERALIDAPLRNRKRRHGSAKQDAFAVQKGSFPALADSKMGTIALYHGIERISSYFVSKRRQCMTFFKQKDISICPINRMDYLEPPRRPRHAVTGRLTVSQFPSGMLGERRERCRNQPVVRVRRAMGFGNRLFQTAGFELR